MELRSRSCALFLLLAVILQCSVYGHIVQKRDAYDDDDFLGDEANEEWAQNDSDGGNPEDNEILISSNILTKPTSYNVTEGQTLVLECRVDPPEGPVVSWSKGNSLLFMGSIRATQDPRISRDDSTNAVQILEVTVADEGEYTCEVAQRNKTSITHTVVVFTKPRITRFYAKNNDQGYVAEGTDLEMTCEVAGKPPSQIYWSREVDGGNVRLSEKDGDFKLNSVVIRKIRPEQGGKYYCYALNGIDSAQAELVIKVLAKPHAHLHKTVVNTAVGDRALLQCTARGDPAPEILWMKDGVFLQPDDRHLFINRSGPHSELTVVPQGDRDFGTYTCVVSNFHNTHNKSAELVQRPVVEQLAVKDRVLSFTVHSHQPLEQVQVQLIDDMGNITTLDVPFSKSSGKSLELRYDLSDLSLGKYQAVVKARNNKEWSQTEQPVVIEFEDQPINIQRSSVYRGSADSISRPTTSVLATCIMYLLIRMF